MPTISLKQICERYFYRRPVFISLDIEGMEGKALEQNEWNNSYCRPDVWIVEVFKEEKSDDGTKRYNQSLAEELLSRNGYKAIETDSHMDVVYVEEKVYDTYKNRFDKFDREGSRMVKVDEIVNPLYQFFGMKRNWRHDYHYISLEDPLYIHLSRAGETIVPEKLNELSNQEGSTMNRPIIIYSFNPKKSQILIQEEKLSYKVVKVGQLNYWCFTFMRKDGKVYQIYVLDHEF